MPRSKITLDPETKRARRQEALKRYATKHKTKLRAAAKERMRRIRAQAPSETQKNNKLKSATKYRGKNRESIRAADALRRARKCIETDGVEAYDEHFQRRSMARTQRKYEKRPPSPRPKPSVILGAARYAREIAGISESESDSDCSESEESDSEESSIPGPSIHRIGGPQPRSPTPVDLDCDCLLPAYCPKCTCSCDYMCCLRHHANESDYRKWMKGLTLEEEQLRRQGLRIVS
ncbi:hypothetical protein C8R45DRAFT_88860 [Mycena sanguinolenta]|nr:hypothetical protein C8R45DRAFT_88860 [Mycena sanguinolenta]